MCFGLNFPNFKAMEDFKSFLEKNRRAWNQRAEIHMASGFYDVAGFKEGKTSLKHIEREILGEITGKSILHLQCHFGQDTLSLARLGANTTGVDFSERAIDYAKELSEELGVPARFVLSDVLALDLRETFDLVFASYGVIGWVPDLGKWAETVARHLGVGGELILVEFHPFMWLLDEKTRFPYFYSPEPDIETEQGTYTDGGEGTAITSCWWNHALSELFSCLKAAGMEVILFEEFDHSPYPLEGMVERGSGEHVFKSREDQRLPYCYAIKATKKV